MRYIIIFLLSFLPLFLAAQNWVTTKSEAGKFVVTSPSEMKELVHTATTAVGELEYHTFVYRDESEAADNWMYSVSYVDYPLGSLHTDSTALVADFLEETVLASVESIKGKLVYVNDIQFKGAIGKIWRVDFSEGKGVIRTKAFVKGNRFYTIQTACPKENSLNTSTDHFFKSFDWYVPPSKSKN